jgi:hypothetical protein
MPVAHKQPWAPGMAPGISSVGKICEPFSVALVAAGATPNRNPGTPYLYRQEWPPDSDDDTFNAVTGIPF